MCYICVACCYTLVDNCKLNKYFFVIDSIIMSWEEFQREVLPTGEVKRLLVNPVTPHKGKFELYPSATFSNRLVSAACFVSCF